MHLQKRLRWKFRVGKMQEDVENEYGKSRVACVCYSHDQLRTSTTNVSRLPLPYISCPLLHAYEILGYIDEA